MANNMQYNNPMQSVQFFPQPQGNVYMISNSSEIMTVPVGTTGISVAICLPEGIMFLKSFQNGSPVFLRYKLSSLENTNGIQNPQSQPQNQNSLSNYDSGSLTKILENYDKRLRVLEESSPAKTKPQDKGGSKEWPGI